MSPARSSGWTFPALYRWPASATTRSHASWPRRLRRPPGTSSGSPTPPPASCWERWRTADPTSRPESSSRRCCCRAPRPVRRRSERGERGRVFARVAVAPSRGGGAGVSPARPPGYPSLEQVVRLQELLRDVGLVLLVDRDRLVHRDHRVVRQQGADAVDHVEELLPTERVVLVLVHHHRDVLIAEDALRILQHRVFAACELGVRGEHVRAVHVAGVERLVLDHQRQLLELGVRQAVPLTHALEPLEAVAELGTRPDGEAAELLQVS